MGEGLFTFDVYSSESFEIFTNISSIIKWPQF